MLIYDLPGNKGVENALKRARQMTEFCWTPVRPLPAVICYDEMDGVNQTYGQKLRPWFPQKGLVYSSVQETQKFIGFNVSFEGFVTALSDPDSVLYRQNVYGHGRQNANSWYGVVCSCFVSYVFDLKERWICKSWPHQPNVSYLGQPDVNSLQLLDIVLNEKVHIALITGLARDEAGNVREIEVSESTLPVCRTTRFTPEEFCGYWYGRAFEIYRKSDTKGIRYTPSPFVRIEADPERGIEADPELPPYIVNRDILPDQGSGTNYREDQEIVLDLLQENWDGAEVTNDTGETAYFAAKDHKVTVPVGDPFHRPGFYRACAVQKEGCRRSASTAYAVTGLRIQPADGSAYSTDAGSPAVFPPSAKLTLCFDNPFADEIGPIYIFNAKNSGEAGRFHPLGCGACGTDITLPAEEGDYFIVQTAENRCGEYSSQKLFVRISAEG